MGFALMLVNEGSYEARRSAFPDRVEVRVRSERRRSWSDQDKLAIVRETLAPGAVAQAVAERHGIGTGLLYTWRRQMLVAAMTGFAAVEITPEAAAVLQVTDGTAAPSPAAAQPEVPSATEAATPPARPGLIEVELPAGVRLRVGADVDGPALRRCGACWRRLPPP
jgi:transposase